MNNYNPLEKRKVKPEKVVKILAQHGTEVTIEQAQLILDFAYIFAKLWLKEVKMKGFDKVQPRVKTPRKIYR